MYRFSAAVPSRGLSSRGWSKLGRSGLVSKRSLSPVGGKVCTRGKAWFSTPSWSGGGNMNLQGAATSVEKRSGLKPIAATSTDSRNEGRVLELAVASALAFVSSASLVYFFPTKRSSEENKSQCEGDVKISGIANGGRPYATMSMYAANSAAEFLHHTTLGSHRNEESEIPSSAFSQEKRRHEPYDVSVRAIKGGRVTMEDEYFVAEGGRFVAVFDGHGGGGVSQFLKRHLYEEVCRHLKKKHWEEVGLVDDKQASSGLTTKSQTTATLSSPSVFSHAAALKAAFSQVDSDVLSDDTLGYQGSTAVAVVVHEGEDGHRTLLSANVGDSRAILSRRGRAVDLTRDHKPNEEREKKRILAMGETIEWDRYAKVHRVRNLSLSRAIGDRYAKPAISGDVEIKHYPVDEDGDEFILLASDGLWDVMTSNEAVSYVHQRISNELQRENVAREDIDNYKLVLRRNMAKFVAREAIRRGSGDNVCVIMVWLNDLKADGRA